MVSKASSHLVRLDDLILDVNNPRFAELYNGSHKEEDLIEYLLYSEAAEEVAKAIVNAGEFYPDRPLWVIKQGNKFLVKDGNRRCAAVKALEIPGKYKLDLPKTVFTHLPVLEYIKQDDIDARIVQEHAGNLFRRWERIAKALEVLKLAESGKFEEMRELDSKPGDLIKLASFYKKAVVIGGDRLRRLLRRGRGKTGGRTIIFERLFKDAKSCGYYFKNSPSFQAEILDAVKFSSYIKAMIAYLEAHPETTTDTIDKNRNFLAELKPFGFTPGKTTSSTNGTSTNDATYGISKSTGSGENVASDTKGGKTAGGAGSASSAGRGSTKKYPVIKRKAMPPGLRELIKEYFDLDANAQTNSKIAMARVTFECVLKFVIEHTKFNGRTPMYKSGYFGQVYSGRRYTDFALMKTKFTDLVIIAADRNAVKSFDLDHLHQIIHNYKVSAVGTVATQISNNLLELIEFLLQDEPDLLSSLDITKL